MRDAKTHASYAEVTGGVSVRGKDVRAIFYNKSPESVQSTLLSRMESEKSWFWSGKSNNNNNLAEQHECKLTGFLYLRKQLNHSWSKWVLLEEQQHLKRKVSDCCLYCKEQRKKNNNESKSSTHRVSNYEWEEMTGEILTRLLPVDHSVPTEGQKVVWGGRNKKSFFSDRNFYIRVQIDTGWYCWHVSR